MKRTARRTDLDAGQQLLFSDRPTFAERTATGELIDMSNNAQTNGFRWPLAVSAELCRHVQTIPRAYARAETVASRWQHVFTLAKPAAAQIIRDRLEKLQVNIVLRTTAAPEKSREHFKALCLTVERSDEAKEAFALGYCVEK
jgi:hypothetical protein